MKLKLLQILYYNKYIIKYVVILRIYPSVYTSPPYRVVYHVYYNHPHPQYR